MKILPLAVVLLLSLTGCVSSWSKSRTERQLLLVLNDVFQQENSVPGNEHIKEISKPALHHEMRVRSVNYQRNKARILPLLRTLIRQYERDEAGFVATVEQMALEAGCSSALCGVVRMYFSALDFDFSYTLEAPLNPKYRYSQTTMDDRSDPWGFEAARKKRLPTATRPAS